MYKMKKVLSISMFIFALFSMTSVTFASIGESYNFERIGIKEGLSQATVEALHQDKNGYIWVGTNDGLNRYNGYEMKYYKHDKYNKNTLSNNYIVDIIDGEEGYIWISTIDGLNKMNLKSGDIKQYYTEDGLPDNNLWEILYTSKNQLIVSSINGLSVYNPNSDSFKRVLKFELPSQYIYSLEEDKYGYIWIGTDKGLVKCDDKFNIVKDYSNLVNNSEIYRVYDDGKDNLWVSTVGNGLYRINLKTDDIKNYEIIGGSARDTIIDRQGDLWICTDSGISKFDYKTEKIISYQREASEENSLSNNQTFTLMEDFSGLIWIGTYNGISKFNPNSSFKYFTSVNNSGVSVTKDPIHGIYENNNALWLGTNANGVNVLDMKENIAYRITMDNSDLLDNNISSIIGKDNKVYIGTNGGLTVVDTNKNIYSKEAITNYTDEDGMPIKKVRSLFMDDKGLVWIGTTKGVAVLNTETGNITDLSYLLKKVGITDALIRSIYQDSTGDYYIGCFLEKGLVVIDSETGSIELYKNKEHDNTTISNDTIRDIIEYDKDTILVGTSHGLNIFNKKTKKFTHYTEKDGLPNNAVYGILVDDNDYIWMSTNYGISKFDLKNEEFDNFTVLDGLQSNEFNGKSSFKSKDGIFLFGGTYGFNSFNPLDLNVFESKPEVSFDEFKVMGVTTPFSDKNELRYCENNIEISFFTNDYKGSKSIKYYYKIDATNTKWDVTNKNSILLAELRPGNHTLRIKAQNSAGIMSDEKTISFTIKPPIWRSKWACILYIVLIIVIVRLNQIKVKRLDKLVETRTKDLRLEMKKNEKLFNKVLELEKNKNKYFVNLSHELRTPLNVLNSINQLIVGLASNDENISNDKILYYMDIMKRNSDRLLNLINNIIDSAKLDARNYVINRRIENIVYVVEETALSLKDYINSKDLELIIDTDVEEKFVKCDKTEIERCVINLIGNAVKFTPEGGTIEIIITDLDSKVRISVKDTGIGISEENQKSIFNRFNQVIDTESESKNGSGLGLTIVKQLVELHKGEISVKSELGKGSEFIIVLPVEQD